jgi:hypothetical protein
MRDLNVIFLFSLPELLQSFIWRENCPCRKGSWHSAVNCVTSLPWVRRHLSALKHRVVVDGAESCLLW